MRRVERQAWRFKARFRRHAFGWRSQPAIQRVKEAVAEIKSVSRTDAVGAAVNNAIATLVPLIAQAPADATTRATWLDRLFEAHGEDQIPYIESLADHWGELCASKAVASQWADRLCEEI